MHRHTPTACTVRMSRLISEELKRQEEREVRGSKGKQCFTVQAFSGEASSVTLNITF